MHVYFITFVVSCFKERKREIAREREREREREEERELTRRLVKVLSFMISVAIDVLLHWRTADMRRTTCNLVLPSGGSRVPTVVCIIPTCT